MYNLRKRQRNLSQGLNIFYPMAFFNFFVNLIYVFTGWFAITIEAFLRYDFGERYYSRGNAMIGLIMLTILTFFSNVSYWIISIRMGGGWFHLLWWGFVVLTIVHFFKMWLNSQMGTPKHSLYSGRSHLEPLANILLKLLNPALTTITKLLGRFFLRGEEYERFTHSFTLSPVIKDAEVFTKRTLEPVIVLLAAWFLTSGTLFLWLLICAFSLAMHSNIAYNELHKDYLDMADSMIEALEQKHQAQHQQSIRSSLTKLTEKLKQRSNQDPEFFQQIKESSPSIAEAIAALNDQQGSSTT